jgi:hypothetical protein
MVIDLDDVVGQAEVADRLGVRVQQVYMWEKRRAGTKFPERLTTLRMGPLYSWSAVQSWHQGYRPDKRPMRNRPEARDGS